MITAEGNSLKEANLNSSPPEPGTTLLSAAHVEAKVVEPIKKLYICDPSTLFH
ncbi:hypothetical protein MTR_1g069125 [Medicago truncatula]|uniref:Uncharacterized protein n=1 Tax=Medicago truncatula TaxID=3880 RepID=A0A072VLE0_MEDTR|nr:hypothetical protein MTR_1g069125 [Medicago truncatula]